MNKSRVIIASVSTLCVSYLAGHLIAPSPEVTPDPPSSIPEIQRSSLQTNTPSRFSLPLESNLDSKKESTPSDFDLEALMHSLKSDWQQESQSERQMDRLLAFAAEIDQELLLAILESLTHSDDFSQQLLRALFVRLTTLDPYLAAAQTEQLPPSYSRDQAMLEVVLHWAESDPTSAMAWLASWPQKSFGHTIATSEIRQLFAEVDPSDFTHFGTIIKELPPGKTQSALADGLAQEWGQRNIREAINWAKELPSSDAQERALVQLSFRWSKADSEEALDFAKELPTGRDALAVTLASRWARSEPSSAATWATALEDAQRRSKTISGVAAVWANKDPEAAARFVFQLPEGEQRDNATLSVVSNWARKSPSAAAHCVEGLPTGSMKEKAIENVAYFWAQSDPDAALNWIEQMPIEAIR